MPLSDREKNVFLARLNGQAGRYEATKKLVNKTLETGVEPSAEEQMLLSIAYSKLQHALRDSWRVTSALEQEEKAKEDSDKVKLIKEFREGIEVEIQDLCHEVISLVEKKVSPIATTDETRLFCLKMTGDYHRYIAECTTDDKRAVETELSSAAYAEAVKFAQDRFGAGTSHRMSIMVNAAVFYHDFMNMQDYAVELTESELNKAAEAVGDSGGEDTKAITGILQANLQLWKADEDD